MKAPLSQYGTLYEVLERKLHRELKPDEKRALEFAGLCGAYEAAANEQEEQEVINEALALLQSLQRRRLSARSARNSFTRTWLVRSSLARAFVAIQWRAIQELLALNSPRGLSHGEQELRNAILEFRQKWLPEGLISVEQIPAWLQAHAEHARQTYTTTVQLTPEQFGALKAALQRGEPYELTLTRENLTALSASVDTVFYGGRPYQIAPELRTALNALAEATGWNEQQCLEFLLSGVMPEGLPASIGVSASLVWQDVPLIALRVPAFAAAEQIAEAYRQVQKEVLKRALVRGISEKRAELIRFVERYRVEHPRATWKQIAEAWNEYCKQQGKPDDWHTTAELLRINYERQDVRAVMDMAAGD
jgi:hypothetical protein